MPKLYLFAAIFLLISCQSTKNPKEQPKPNGYFVNQTFIENISIHHPQYVHAYCLELGFNKSDSAFMANGIEFAYLRFKKINDKYAFDQAFWDGEKMMDLPFEFINDSILIVYDSVYTGKPGISKFIKIDTSKTTFEILINAQTFAGKYMVKKFDRKLEHVVDFDLNGQLSGLENYKKYRVCYDGDCLQETSVPSGIIYLYDESEKATCFSWNRKNHSKSIIELYAVEAPIPDIKGERRILEKVYELERMKP